MLPTNGEGDTAGAAVGCGLRRCRRRWKRHLGRRHGGHRALRHRPPLRRRTGPATRCQLPAVFSPPPRAAAAAQRIDDEPAPQVRLSREHPGGRPTPHAVLLPVHVHDLSLAAEVPMKHSAVAARIRRTFVATALRALAPWPAGSDAAGRPAGVLDHRGAGQPGAGAVGGVPHRGQRGAHGRLQQCQHLPGLLRSEQVLPVQLQRDRKTCATSIRRRWPPAASAPAATTPSGAATS